MKELSVEEKAIRYDEAIERAKGAHNSAKSDKENGVTDKITEYTIQLTETIFPELKESEDERIRKAIIDFFKDAKQGLELQERDNNQWQIEKYEIFIDWLEKQVGKHNSTKAKAGEKYKCIAAPKYTCFCTGYVYEVESEFMAQLIDACEGCFELTHEEKINPLLTLERAIEMSPFVEQKPANRVEPKFREGKYYTCIKDCSLNKEYHKGGVYKAVVNRIGKISLTSDKDYVFPIKNESVFNEYFRLATNEEIEEISGNQGKISPNESKFKKGEWVVYDGWTTQIMEVYEDGYANDRQGFIPKVREDSMRKWTINDAKDGDVLVTQKTNVTYESIFIFNKIENNRIIQYLHYFTTDADEEVCETRSIDGFLGFVGTNVHPATKEQRNALMKAMANAGWEFDFEKKELKKIYNEIEIPFGAKDGELQEVTYYIPKGFHAEINDDNVVIKKGEKPTAWSEEDEEIHRKCICAMRASACGFPEEEKFVEQVDNWINSLKERVQPKQEWSEEDKKLIDEICNIINTLASGYGEKVTEPITFSGTQMIASIKDRLMALVENRPGRGWKPSSEQIKAVKEAACYNSVFSEKTIDNLISLSKQLKKLREE